MSQTPRFEVPTKWEMVPLGDHLTLINGRAYKAEELLNEGTPVIRIQNLNGGDRWYYSDLELPPDKYCDKGDLLFAWSATFGPYIWNGTKSIYHYHIWKVLPKKTIEKRYAFRMLEWVTDSIKAAAHGVTMVHITKESMENWKIPLPPLPEQQRIAAILDQADALRTKRRTALAKLDTLLQATFLHMFGDPVTNPMGWVEMKLFETAEKFSDGPFGSNLKTEHYTQSGVQVIRLQNVGIGYLNESDKAFISEGHFQSLPRHHCSPGDIIIGTMGDPNLRACIVPEHIEKCLNKADCVQYRVDSRIMNRDYACWLLNNPRIIKKASKLSLGQTRLRISMGRLKELIVPVPPMDKQMIFF